MCTVLGYFGADMPQEVFEGYLRRTESRGPDASQVVRLPGGGLLGFH